MMKFMNILEIGVAWAYMCFVGSYVENKYLSFQCVSLSTVSITFTYISFP